MAKKRKQHFVPRVYLKSFCDPTSPAGWPADRPFEPALWLLAKSLAEHPERRAPAKVMWSSQTYTLRSDDPEHPVIEDQLAALESEYAGVLPRVLAHADLTDREWIILLVFVGALFHRTLSQMAFQQEQVDKLQHIYRQVDHGANGDEAYSDEFWAGADEAGKRMAIQGAGGHARVLDAAGPWFLVNESPFPFITSDCPVTHHFLHIDELAAMGFPQERWHPNARPSDKAFLSFCPLSPTIALVSSPLLLPPGDSPFWKTQSAVLIGNLNLLTRARADELLISLVAQPFGPNQSRLLEYEAQRDAEPIDTRPTLLVYTDRSRHLLRLESYTHHPAIFDSRLTFVTKDMAELRALAGAEWIEVATLNDEQREIGMRELVLLYVALDPEAPSELVQDLGRERPKRAGRVPLDELATNIDMGEPETLGE